MKLNVLNTTGKNTTITVSDEVFAGKVNLPLMSQAVRVILSNQRQGTSKVKTRSEVRRTKKKWFKQKGTGNARHGARNANIFVGGGIVHGPDGTQNWTLSLSKQMKRKALISALSSQGENIIVTTVLDDVKPKTKDVVAYLSKLVPGDKRILLVVDKMNENILLSTNNLEYVFVTTAQRLNVHETLLADSIILTKDAVKSLEERLSGTPVIAQEDELATEVVAEEVVEKPKKAVKKTVKKEVTKE